MVINVPPWVGKEIQIPLRIIRHQYHLSLRINIENIVKFQELTPLIDPAHPRSPPLTPLTNARSPTRSTVTHALHLSSYSLFDYTMPTYVEPSTPFIVLHVIIFFD